MSCNIQYSSNPQSPKQVDNSINVLSDEPGNTYSLSPQSSNHLARTTPLSQGQKDDNMDSMSLQNSDPLSCTVPPSCPYSISPFISLIQYQRRKKSQASMLSNTTSWK